MFPKTSGTEDSGTACSGVVTVVASVVGGVGVFAT